MGITLYRRHLKSCRVHKKKLSAEQKRKFFDCECPIWMYGRTDTHSVPRQSTGTSDPRTAEAQRDRMMAEGKDSTVYGLTLSQCIETHLEAMKEDLGERTHEQHRLHLTRLNDYAKQRGVHHAGDLSVDLLEHFITGLKMKSTSKATAVAKIRVFLAEALRRGWIKEPLHLRLKKRTAVYEQKEPYTDEDLDKILTEAEKLNGGTHGYAKHPKTFLLLLKLMLETGLRVGDAVRFNPKVLTKGDHLWVYRFTPQKTQKNKKPKVLEAFLTDRMKLAIDECTWLSKGLPFYYGESSDTTFMAQQVYERMQEMGKRCGVEDCRPHRLRDTFAVRRLSKGMMIDDVSRLLGHSSVKVTEQYYAKWVPARMKRLESVFAESLTEAS